MLLVGVTGGIGSGKSLFSALLAERGAQVIDADAYGREALRPGQPAWHSVVAQFGQELLIPQSMEIDRQALAEMVFNDHDKLAALNAIVHPVLFSAIADSVERLSQTDEIVVIDAAILVETGMDKNLDTLIVVHTDESLRRERLKSRGMSSADIEARMSSQASSVNLLAKADLVVCNNGSLDRLVREAERVWGDLSSRLLS
ncbi:MAG: dephospho-CoA kinase [Actinobacteria bacterium]|nr:dephospho-CoA kinase [Actinomycetota bacterium]